MLENVQEAVSSEDSRLSVRARGRELSEEVENVGGFVDHRHEFQKAESFPE